MNAPISLRVSRYATRLVMALHAIGLLAVALVVTPLLQAADPPAPATDPPKATQPANAESGASIQAETAAAAKAASPASIKAASGAPAKGKSAGATKAESAASVEVFPKKLVLQGRLERGQIVVLRGSPTTATADLTPQARYIPADPKIVTVNQRGLVTPLANGRTTIAVEVEGQRHSVEVEVAGIEATHGSKFTWHVIPMLNRAGCTGGGCHASQFGQAGFKLSLLGYAPEQDYPEIATDRIGRRLNLLEPDRSLFLLKPTLQVAHGGGRRFARDSYE